VVSLGYVGHDDVLTPQLTVREALTHAATLRAPRSNGDAARLDRLVGTTLHRLDLLSVADSPIGHPSRTVLSSGQRRRVSIGLELVSRCTVLLLDEPTSGLSSTGAQQVLQVLAKIAATGVTIVAVVHQPPTAQLHLFDQLVVMSNGRVHYAGAPTADAARAALSNESHPVVAMLGGGGSVNVADVLVDNADAFPVVTDETLRASARRSRVAARRRLVIGRGEVASVSSDEEEVAEIVVVEPILAKPRPPLRLPWLQQVMLFARRAAIQTARSPDTFFFLYGLVLSVSIVLSWIYEGSRYVGPFPGALLAQCPSSFASECRLNREDTYLIQGTLIALALALTSAIASVSTFGGAERDVFVRESRTGVISTSAYFLGKQMADTVHMFVPPLLFTAVFVLWTVPPIETFTLYVVALGAWVVGSGVAQLMSVATSDARAMVWSAAVVGVSVLVGGVSSNVHNASESSTARWLGTVLPRVTFAYWTIEGFYLGVTETYDGIYDTFIGVSNAGFTESEASTALLVPLAMGAALRLAALACLRWTKAA
jgi:ABC-type multidrug transport system ATPase subunit